MEKIYRRETSWAEKAINQRVRRFVAFFKGMGRDMLCILLASVDSPQDKRKLELLYEKIQPAYVRGSNACFASSADAEDACLTSWEKVIKI